MKPVVMVLCVCLLSGCAHRLSPAKSELSQACQEPSQEQMLALNLAQQMSEQGRLHAALANLQTLPRSLVQGRLEQAKLMRSLGLEQARDEYEGLLNSCLAAEAHHGLGQLAAASGRMERALEHLQMARQLNPTSAKVRNDLGIAYLGTGQQSLARFEFLTALELDQQDRQPALNLLTLLFYQERLQQAGEMAAQMKFSPDQVSEAQGLAIRLRQTNTPAIDG